MIFNSNWPVQLLLTSYALCNFFCWSSNYYFKYKQLECRLLITTFFILQVLCYILVIIECFILCYHKISSGLIIHIKWLILIFRCCTFLNQSINTQLQYNLMGETLEIIQEFYVIYKYFEDNSFNRIQCKHLYTLLYFMLLGYCRIDISNAFDWILFITLILFLTTLKVQQNQQLVFQKKQEKNYNIYTSPRIHDHDSVLLPIQLQLANSKNEQKSYSKREQDIFDHVPFGVAIVDTLCKVTYCNSNLMEIFQVNDVKFLERALQTFKIQSMTQRQESFDSEQIQQMEIVYNPRQKALSFFQLPSQIQYQTLDAYLNILRHEIFSKIRDEKMVFITNTDTKFLPPSYVIGIFPCTIKSYQSVNFTQGDFMLFFFDMDDYQKVISRDISLQLMNQMFKSFSHEFGTSLNCISALAQSALDSIQDRQILDTIIQPIFCSSLIMCSIVQDMRDFNLFLSQSFEMKVEENVNLIETINRVKKMFETQLQHKNIYFTINIERKCRRKISTDPNRLHQILVNLISNAQKNTSEGFIEVVIQRWAHQNQDYIKFEVKDTGIGMQQSNKNRLEDLLNMGINQQRYNKNQNQTFGFGLMISNLIVQSLGDLSRQQGGGIQFISEINKGSTFSFLIFDFTAVMKDQAESELNTQSVVQKQGAFFSPMLQRKQESNKFIKKNSWQLKNVLDTNFRKSKKNTQIQQYFCQFQKTDKDALFEAVPSESKDSGEQQSLVKIQSWKVRNPANKDNNFESNHILLDTSLLLKQCKCNDVMIVDDEYFNITALQGLLKTFGIEADFAICGKNALKQYEDRLKFPCLECKKLYTLIFMDINMPQMDGFVTSTQLLQIATEFDLEPPTIVAQTAFTDFETEKMSYLSGMKFFMTKAIQKKELKLILQSCNRVI